MSTTRGANPKQKRFGLKKTLLILLSAIIFLGTVSYITFETVTADVQVIQDGEKINTTTTAADVGEVMNELGIEVSKHDDLSVNLDEELQDGMVIEYTKANQVNVTIDQETKEFYTTKETVQQFLKEKSIKLGKYDEISVDMEAPIEEGLEVQIDKAFEVTVKDGGETKTAKVTNQTVGEFLASLDIDLNEQDRINAKLDDPVKEKRSIEIVRVTTETETEEVAVPFQTERKEDSDMLRGKSKVVKSGQEGKKVLTYEITKENGEVVSKDLVEEKVVQESVNRVVAEGTKVPVQQASADSGEWMTFSSTKYTAFCPSGCTGVTATGINVANSIYYNGLRVIAVDPNVIPLWSKVEVKIGNNTFTAIALDTGGAIKGKKIDILTDSTSDAYRWGRRSVQVRVVD
ncbi:DUF348 domain-containing protein [Filobacillus milosensis]|uniref:DUF348 domain-containing protein n=1 Tax=Filobacillus milosensis TaxID=94137 RepID=A0A4Y8IM16_9BACI|nr:G5 and 3D domain-containing protein [Filobacillus milosensis]TFB21048.1 DUF348 domain-containing protein [Filobacillus milosensis]